ncbi:MAG: radical SAM protein [Planctomycetes bacterium]|nr:radical SAM protein [Planctomycetota bacterium]
MILVITNKCNRRCDFCFEGSFKDEPHRMMSLDDVERICRFANLPHVQRPLVSVMGGEPTLHPQLVEIVDLILRLNRTTDVQLLSNLLCDQVLLRELAPRRIGALVNVSGLPGYRDDERDLLFANLKLLREESVFRGLCLAVTIVAEDQDFTFLYDLLKQDEPQSIGGIRIGIAIPGTNFENRFARELSLGYGDKYLEIVEECHRIRPNLGFTNECCVNLCMMSEEVFNRLAPVVSNLKTFCAGNLDLMPDFSTHWCYAFQGHPELRIRNIFDYRSMDEVYDELCRRMVAVDKELGVQCDTAHCKSLRCIGPCLALKYYEKHVVSKS